MITVNNATFKVFVHPANEYPDIFAATSSPVKLKVGYESDVILGVGKIGTTNIFDRLTLEERDCLAERETPELRQPFKSMG